MSNDLDLILSLQKIAKRVRTLETRGISIGDAPDDGSEYVRKSKTWSVNTGGGDVSGPASSIDGDIVLFNLATGKLLKDSGINISAFPVKCSSADINTGTDDSKFATSLAIAGSNIVFTTKAQTLSGKTLTAPIVSILKPASDSTTAIQVTQADGSTPVLTFDTTNRKLELGYALSSAPSFTISGGRYGSDLLTLVRTEGATQTFGFCLQGGGLSFHDVTHSVYPFTLVGASTTGVLFIGQNAKGAGTPIAGTLRGENLSSGWGTDIAAANFTIIGTCGTGAGAGGDILFQTSNAGSTGTTAHGVTTKLAIKGTSGSLSVVDGANFWFGTTTGTKIGANTNMKLAFWSATPIVQPTGAAQVAPAAYATGAYGLDSDAHMQALYDLIVAMRTVLVNTGLMKGAA
jgi:hypothetical protein